MGLNLRPAVKEDAAVLIGLITELARFESLPPPDAEARERMVRDGWPEDGRPPRFQAWIAEWSELPDEDPVQAGYALTFYTYSTFLLRPTLFLEDLFVLPAYRNRGIGKTILQTLHDRAVAEGCGRMEWMVLDWNENAQQVYQSMGAHHMTGWQLYRWDLLEAQADH